MPPFVGSVKEREAVASYIVNGLHKKPDEKKTFPLLSPLPLEIPPFDEDSDGYILLAWTDVGIQSLSDNDKYFSIFPPGITVFVQLIKRGETPEIVSENIELTYKIGSGFENPSRHVDFWKFAKVLFGKSLKNDKGLKGNGVAGKMVFKEQYNAFVAEAVPVMPYPDNGPYNPYPLMTIEARDKASGKTIASTRCVLPVSTEMGCKNCHGGRWRFNNKAGIDAETSIDVLAVHDRMSKTDLLKSPSAGQPERCQSCHADPFLNAQGKPGLLNLSASIHGFHANYLSERGADACESCHPVSSSGGTRGFRGIHAKMGLTCISCHGTLKDHAMSLLLKEYKAGKPGALRLMRHLKPRLASNMEEINPRSPWMNEPDCMNCHIDFMPPLSNASGFNRWTKSEKDLYRMRFDEMGIMCEACHGSTHALYPAENPYGKDRDNIQPNQLG